MGRSTHNLRHCPLHIHGSPVADNGALRRFRIAIEPVVREQQLQQRHATNNLRKFPAVGLGLFISSSGSHALEH